MTDIWEQIENDDTDQPLQIAVDPDDTAIFLSREVWQNHILLRHPEMVDFKDLIVAAITSPDKREYDVRTPNVIRCYKNVPPERQITASHLKVRVVVKYTQPPEREYERTGLISSVYLVRWKVE